MIDVSRYPGSQSRLGKILRAPLRLIPRNTVVPILQGPLRGKRWIVGSGISRLWLGSYEPEVMALAKSLLSPGDVALDIGANVGIYSLLFSQAVGPTGRVVAFEPSPGNVRYLRQHAALNSATNLSIEQAAVCDKTARTTMNGDGHSTTLRLSADGSAEVEAVRLDDFLAATKIVPDLIKVDVEGAELEVLRGASGVLKEIAPDLLIATHSASLKAECIQTLKNYGYVVEDVGPNVRDELYATARKRTHSGPRNGAVGMPGER